VLGVAGAVSALAMAPTFAWPVLFLTLPVLIWAIDASVNEPEASSRGWRRRALACSRTGWFFGFGYFLAGLFWVGEAFLVEAERFAALIPLAVTLLPGGLALFWAAATAAVSLIWERGPARIVVLALALGCAEWLRGHVLTGLPWNVLGYALTWPLPLMQSAAVLGIYGLTLVSVCVFAAPAVVWVGAWMAAGAIAVFAVLGAVRLAQSEPPARQNVRVRLVQPSVPQREKWRPENQERIFRRHLELSVTSPTGVRDSAQGINLIVWPEASMPFLPLATRRALAEIGRMLPPTAHLAAGALRVQDRPAGGRASGRPRIFNSLMIFGQEGQLAAVYDKVHLVPFGEYLPLQSMLEAIGLEQLTRIRGGFDAGPSPRPLLEVPGLPVMGPLICYEAIFPGAVVQDERRPDTLLNLTNDGWFGNTTGPRQHLHQARVRAVEEGLPLLRAANNGISAVIDAKGRVLDRLELDEAGVIDATLPAALEAPPYAVYGDLLFAAALGFGGLWVGFRVFARGTSG
jgi:apolipoprotein N-acyltransferase